ncbi:flagellar motor switch protein FliG [Lentibacter algarum]|nr:flagellar motor switch protein FliG [Lentibacter algarum]
MTPQKSQQPKTIGAHQLSSKQKAAVIVRFLLNEGADVPLERLTDASQTMLAQQMSDMRYIDRDTLASVLSEFAAEIEKMGLTFPQGLAEALAALEGRISPQTAARLRKEAGVRQIGDPWERIRALDLEKLLPIVEEESTEVAAVLLSKLPVSKAADLLAKLPGPRARKITYAVSLTGKVTPEAVDRIGLSLAAQFETEAPRAFEEDPVERLGAILNISASGTRDEVLSGLEEDDAAFSQKLRRAIFTFVHIPARVGPVDVPKIIREVDADDLLTALAFAKASGDAELDAAAEYILGNISKRMGEGLREEISEKGAVKAKDGEAAMNLLVAGIGELTARGELELILEEVSEEDTSS